jgi:hypothetical protein
MILCTRDILLGRCSEAKTPWQYYKSNDNVRQILHFFSLSFSSVVSLDLIWFGSGQKEKLNAFLALSSG